MRTFSALAATLVLSIIFFGCSPGHNIVGQISPTPTPTPTPTPVAGTFTPTSGSLTTARSNHTATLFSDGSVLVVGGFDNFFNCSATNQCFVQSSEKFIPSTGFFQAGPSLTVPRNQHTATLLQNGQLLVAGGNNSGGFLLTAELFNPATGVFTLTGSMAQARRQHTATLLANGKVLVAGGFNIDGTGNHSLSSGEVYDPTAASFTNTAPMSTVRTDHSAALLTNGKVLIAGGNIPCTPTLCGTVLNAFATAELYDPSTNQFSNTGSMTTARFQHTATVLPSGQVVIAGGQTVNASNTAYVAISSIEIYDPASGAFTSGGNLLVPRAQHTATLLPNGQIVFAGGIDASGNAIKSAELYTPSTHASIAVQDMETVRTFHTATLLQNGQVVVIGGADATSSLGSAEIFK